jgi:hypothetical protein
MSDPNEIVGHKTFINDDSTLTILRTISIDQGSGLALVELSNSMYVVGIGVHNEEYYRERDSLDYYYGPSLTAAQRIYHHFLENHK